MLEWIAYFGIVGHSGVFIRDLAQWIHRRLRTLQLRQWKRGRTAYRELRARGVSENVALASCSDRAKAGGTWLRKTTVHTAMPRAYFGELGVPRLTPY